MTSLETWVDDVILGRCGWAGRAVLGSALEELRT